MKNKIGLKVEFNSVSYKGQILKREQLRKTKVKKAKSENKKKKQWKVTQTNANKSKAVEGLQSI